MDLERLITRGIQRKIPINIQLLLWDMQSKLREEYKKIDYLQVYRLEVIQKNRLSASISFRSNTKRFAVDRTYSRTTILSNVLLLCCG